MGPDLGVQRWQSLANVGGIRQSDGTEPELARPPIKYPCGRAARSAATATAGLPTPATRLLREARRITVAALIRTAVLACLLALFYAGHKSQPFELDIRRTPATPHASPSPELMERRGPFPHR